MGHCCSKRNKSFQKNSVDNSSVNDIELVPIDELSLNDKQKNNDKIDEYKFPKFLNKSSYDSPKIIKFKESLNEPKNKYKKEKLNVKENYIFKKNYDNVNRHGKVKIENVLGNDYFILNITKNSVEMSDDWKFVEICYNEALRFIDSTKKIFVKGRDSKDILDKFNKINNTPFEELYGTIFDNNKDNSFRDNNELVIVDHFIYTKTKCDILCYVTNITNLQLVVKYKNIRYVIPPNKHYNYKIKTKKY